MHPDRISKIIANVDVRQELENFSWKKSTWTNEKLIACSPFRDDNSPSFFVTFEGEYKGIFGDSAYEDGYYKSGSFVKLLAYLREETEEETFEYLRDKYDYEYSRHDIELILPNIDFEDRSNEIKFQNIEHDTEYLISRGISQKIINFNNVFDNRESIGICWYDTNGKLAAVKYRHKRTKEFWYHKGSQKISELVFGLDKVYQRRIKTVAICEGEIDAMTWQSAGVYAIAVGGSGINERQINLIINSGIETVILSGDNDKQGQRLNRQVEQAMKNHVEILRLDYSEFGDKKDVNELGVENVKKLTLNKTTPLIRLG